MDTFLHFAAIGLGLSLGLAPMWIGLCMAISESGSNYTRRRRSRTNERKGREPGQTHKGLN